MLSYNMLRFVSVSQFDSRPWIEAVLMMTIRQWEISFYVWCEYSFITNEIICQIQFWYMARVVRVWIDLMRIRAEKRPLKAFFNTEPRPCQFSVNQSKNFFLIFKSENTMAKVKIFILQYGNHRYSSWYISFWPDVREKISGLWLGSGV